MRKKLTLTIDEEVYDALRKVIGPRKISKFIEELVRPHVIRPNLESVYAEMARDKRREKEAVEWAELAFKDLVPGRTCRPRAGWSEAAKEMRERDEDLLLDLPTTSHFGEKESDW